MYQIKCDDDIIYDPRDVRLSILNPQLSQEVNKVCELSFYLPFDHPYYDSITKLKSVIRLYKDSTLVFKGRAWSDEQDVYKTKDILCESALAYLLDSRIRPFEFQGSILEFLTAIITEHNEQVNVSQQFILGDVTVTDPNGYIARSSINYLSPWEVINTRLIDTHGGYLQVRFDEDENCVLDYLADFSDTSTQVIRLGENIVDMLIKNSGEEMYTAVIPLGAKLSDINPDTEDDTRITIVEVNDGDDYLINSTLAAEYGVIYAPTDDTTWDDVTLPANLKTKGLAYLNDTATRWTQMMSLTAIDLHNMDVSVEELKFCEKVPVISALHDLEEIYLISAIQIPLNNPAEARITLGETKLTYVGESVKKTNSAITRIGNIERDYATKAKAAEIASEVINNNTSILQSAQQIIMSALEEYTRTEDFTQLQSAVETQFSIMAGQIDIVFTTATSQISTLNGETKQQFDNIEKYIRFLDGSIVLGQSDSQIKLRIENDILYFFAGADDAADIDTAFAYFSAGKMYVTDADIVKSLKIGNFSFTPRANGNLSYRKAN